MRGRTARQSEFQSFLKLLRRNYRNRPVALLLDSVGSHTTPSSLRLAVQLRITLIWLPKQWSELNAMDQMWKELKRLGRDLVDRLALSQPFCQYNTKVPAASPPADCAVNRRQWTMVALPTISSRNQQPLASEGIPVPAGPEGLREGVGRGLPQSARGC